MDSCRTLSTVSATAMAVLALTGCGDNGATVATFAGTWQGHGRTLKITEGGLAKEWIYSGCCHLVLVMELRLSSPHGPPRAATATATVKAVRISDRSWFTKANPAPRMSESGPIRRRGGVIIETLTGTRYCGSGIKDSIDAGCGA